MEAADLFRVKLFRVVLEAADLFRVVLEAADLFRVKLFLSSEFELEADTTTPIQTPTLIGPLSVRCEPHRTYSAPPPSVDGPND